MKARNRLLLLFRISSRGDDISKEFYKKIATYGGSKRDYIILLGYKSVNKTANNFVNWLIKKGILYQYNINAYGTFDYKINYKMLDEEILENPEYKDDFYSILGFMNGKYTIFGDEWNK